MLLLLPSVHNLDLIMWVKMLLSSLTLDKLTSLFSI